MQRAIDLATSLDLLAEKYHRPDALDMDPLSIPLAYSDPWDRELAAWVAAHLAYGRVAPMLKAIRRALEPMNPSPAAWLRATPQPAARKALEAALQGWVWRFHTCFDLVEWILVWKRLDKATGFGGIEPHVLPEPGGSADAALSALIQALRRELPPSRGTRFSLPDPLEGAACKRWRMFFRWMVRTQWPDLGQWQRYPKAALIIPLDTHVARVAGLVGLTTRTTPDGRMAQEITDALKALDPLDPLRFDFALSHLGILGDCPGLRQLPGCAPCPLVGLCGVGVTKRKTP